MGSGDKLGGKMQARRGKRKGGGVFANFDTSLEVDVF